MTTQNLGAVPTDQISVLTAFRDRLLDTVAELTPNNLIITDADDPPPAAMNQRYWCALWVLGGEFDDSLMTGAGSNFVSEAGGVSLSVYRENYDDRVGQDKEALMGGDPTALLKLKHKVLQAMSGQYLFANQQQILLDCIKPLRSDHPRTQKSETGRRANVYLEFGTPFFWNLQNQP